MSRVKISEYRAKMILAEAFGASYGGVSIDLAGDLGSQIEHLKYQEFVVKVDQAIKKRNKLGLVFVKRTKVQALADLKVLHDKGYSYGLVEPFIAHDRTAEKFIALSRTPEGIELQYSEVGGVDIESKSSSIKSCTLDHFIFDQADNKTDLGNDILEKLYKVFVDCLMTYLEINPGLIKDGRLLALDAAVEVDSTAKFFITEKWGNHDLRSANRPGPAERIVEELANQSPASFSLKVLNENGSVFLLLSGGGASVVVADEFATQGLYDKIANYGEYSGNPNADETYVYTKALMQLLLQSKATKKLLFIGGGTANFTDIAKTFTGVINAMDEVKTELKQQGVAVFVRRGGPNQAAGLSAIKKFLDEAGLKNTVSGPDRAIAALVGDAVKELR